MVVSWLQPLSWSHSFLPGPAICWQSKGFYRVGPEFTMYIRPGSARSLCQETRRPWGIPTDTSSRAIYTLFSLSPLGCGYIRISWSIDPLSRRQKPVFRYKR